jgi:ankyrin repeat protein
MTVNKRIYIIAVMAITLLFLLNTASDAASFRLHGMTAQEMFSNSKAAALANAACRGDISKITDLVHSDADVNYRGKGGISPLIWAMSCHNYKGMRALLKKGANPNQPMEYGQTPVWLAAGGSDPKILPILLAHGGDPNAYCAECQGTSALENTIDYQRTANMKLLVQHGANVNFIGGLSIGDDAVSAGRFDYIIYLLHHGYDHDLQGLANAILQKKGLFNPHWFGYPMWKWQYPYWKEALQMLAAKGYKAHKIPWTIAPMNPPPSPAAGSQ